MTMIKTNEAKINGQYESIQSLSTIVLCLIEAQCMQIRADEQDDDDK